MYIDLRIHFNGCCGIHFTFSLIALFLSYGNNHYKRRSGNKGPDESYCCFIGGHTDRMV